MNRAINRQLNAEITVEAAIVVPIVMLVVSGMLYMTLYVHDIIKLRSGAYSAGIEYIFNNNMGDEAVTKISGQALFVIQPHVRVLEEIESYVIEVDLSGNGNISMINIIVNLSNKQKIYIPKRMSENILYGSKALMEEIEKRKGSN